MKSTFRNLMILIFLLTGIGLLSCTTELIEEVKTTFPNGKPETAVYKTKDGRIVSEKQFYENGQLRLLGNYNEDEERDGLWVSYFDDGTIWSECEYKNGMKDGMNNAYYSNGKVRFAGFWKENQRIGEWNSYSENGELIDAETISME